MGPGTSWDVNGLVRQAKQLQVENNGLIYKKIDLTKAHIITPFDASLAQEEGFNMLTLLLTRQSWTWSDRRR